MKVFEIRLQQTLNLFYLNLDASAANHIVFLPLMRKRSFSTLYIYGILFPLYRSLPGLCTDLRSIYPDNLHRSD